MSTAEESDLVQCRGLPMLARVREQAADVQLLHNDTESGRNSIANGFEASKGMSNPKSMACLA